MSKWSKAPDGELSFQVVGSIPRGASNFSTPDCKKNQQGTPSLVNCQYCTKLCFTENIVAETE